MANMSYCRFENTYRDLKDCYEHLNNENLSESENKFRDKLVELCRDIVDEQDDDDDESEE